MTVLRLLSSMAPKDCLAAAIDRYQAGRDVRVTAQAAGGVEVVKRIEGGEAVDIVVLADDAIEKLAAGGHVLASSRTPLMRSGIAAAVKEGTAIPDLGSEEAVRAAVAAAPSISFSTGPSGRYLESLFKRWGLFERIRMRIVVPPPGIAVARLIGEGTVALGFQQMSEMLHAPGITVAGLLPAAIQHQTVFSGVVGHHSSAGAAALELLRYLASDSVAELRPTFGMSAVA